MASTDTDRQHKFFIGTDGHISCENCLLLLSVTDMSVALLDIHYLLSGVEWDAETIGQVAAVLNRYGLTVLDPES